MIKNKLVKGFVIVAGIMAGLVVIGSGVVGGMISYGVLYQNKGKDTSYNSMMQLEKWGYDSETFLNKYEGTLVSTRAEDGNEVPGTYFDDDNNKCVILVHGAGGDRTSSYPLAEEYLERGYDVIAFDQRGSGVNPDDKVTFGIKESLDVKAFVIYAKKELGYNKVYVHGQSMGGQTVAIYASNVEAGSQEAADAVICDSPVPGMELMLKEMFGDGDTEDFMANYLTGMGKIYMKLFNGIDFDDADTIHVVENDNIPTMIIVSNKDEVCLPEQEEQIYANIACEEKAIMYVDSAHVEGVIDDSKGYMEGTVEFLNSLK
ncbi:MAG: alpha/beta hydrolase [Butyrivibrio sp.]|nr:alpha/beta hydrolase [Butyrivibrio sp.]